MTLLKDEEIEINYEIKGKGKSILLISGGIGDKNGSEKLAKHLSRNYKVITYDRRGTGLTLVKKDSNKPDIELQVEDIGRIIKGLKLNKITIFGHSYGAFIAILASLKYQNLINGVMCSEPTFFKIIKDFDRKNYLEVFNQTNKAIKLINNGKKEEGIRYFVNHTLGDKSWDSITFDRKNILIDHYEIYLKSMDISLNYSINFEKLKELNIPLIIFTGGNTHNYFKSTANQILNFIPSCKIVEIPSVGHGLFRFNFEETLKKIKYYLKHIDLIDEHKINISFIIPSHKSSKSLESCLNGIVNSVNIFKNIIYELIVVFDGPQDKKSYEIIKKFNIKPIKIVKNQGEAYARNIGANKSKFNLLFYVDSDVLIDKKTVFNAVYDINFLDYDVAFGAYNLLKKNQNSISKLRSLWQNYIFNKNQGEIKTFWSGCAIMKKEAYEKTKGFNENSSFSGTIDIEFGDSLKKLNKKVILDSQMLCTHLKEWNLFRWIKSDFKERALPWSRLLYLGKAKNSLINKNINSKISILFSTLLISLLIFDIFLNINKTILVILFFGIVLPHLKFYFSALKEYGLTMMLKSIIFLFTRYFLLGLGLLYVLIIEKILRVSYLKKRSYV